jgi:hypothetical protein
MEPPVVQRPAIHITLSGLSRRQILIGIAGTMLAIALATIAIIYVRQYTTLTGLPKSAYANLSFPVYFPRPVEKDFKLDPASISTKPGVLAYTFNYQGSSPVYVSIQPLDPKLDTNSFKPTRTVSTGIGEGYLVEFDTRVTVAIITRKSLVLINSPDHVPSYAIEQLADSFQAVK